MPRRHVLVRSRRAGTRRSGVGVEHRWPGGPRSTNCWRSGRATRAGEGAQPGQGGRGRCQGASSWPPPLCGTGACAGAEAGRRPCAESGSRSHLHAREDAACRGGGTDAEDEGWPRPIDLAMRGCGHQGSPHEPATSTNSRGQVYPAVTTSSDSDSTEAAPPPASPFSTLRHADRVPPLARKIEHMIESGYELDSRRPRASPRGVARHLPAARRTTAYRAPAAAHPLVVGGAVPSVLAGPAVSGLGGAAWGAPCPTYPLTRPDCGRSWRTSTSSSPRTRRSAYTSDSSDRPSSLHWDMPNGRHSSSGRCGR